MGCRASLEMKIVGLQGTSNVPRSVLKTEIRRYGCTGTLCIRTMRIRVIHWDNEREFWSTVVKEIRSIRRNCLRH